MICNLTTDEELPEELAKLKRFDLLEELDITSASKIPSVARQTADKTYETEQNSVDYMSDLRREEGEVIEDFPLETRQGSKEST